MAGESDAPATNIDKSKRKKKRAKLFRVTVQGLKQPRGEGQHFKDRDPLIAFLAAMGCEAAVPEPVIEWSGLRRLAILDVDFHNVPIPEDAIIHIALSGLRPRPDRWWRSHGSGIKLLYAARDPLTAEDLAAIAAHSLKSSCIHASGFEVLSRTRHPAYRRGGELCGPVQYGGSGDDIGDVRRVLLGDYKSGEVEPDKVEEWLDEHGFARGARYSHDRCLIDPEHTSTSKPVVVLPYGVFCHSCEGRGVCKPGLSRPGFIHFSLLVEGEPTRVVNHLRNAVRNMTHWEQAKHIIPDEAAYRALLKLWHLPDSKRRVTTGKLIDKVFFPSIPLVRGNGVWLNADTLEPAVNPRIDDLIAAMPAVRYVPLKGRVALNPVKRAEFRGATDLTKHGYPAITPLRGLDMAERSRAPDDERIFAVTSAKPPFRYRPKSQRDMAAVEAELRRCFPHVNLDALRLMIACKGLVQRGDFSDVPQVFIVGQSRAGKSAHARLAAELCCDRAKEIRFNANPERFIQAYGNASESHGFALFNEASKTPGLTPAGLRDCCLMFTRDLVYHKLYVGPVPISNPAVVVLTDVLLPNALGEDEQTARRIALIDLGAGVNRDESTDWFQTCGTGEIEKWRAGSWGMSNADTADTFVSGVMDNLLSDPSMTFQAAVKSLGFSFLNQHAEAMYADLRELHAAVMALPEFHGDSHWRGSGWRVFNWREESPVARLFREATDEGRDLQRLSAAPWGRITGKPGLTCKPQIRRAQAGLRYAGE